MNMDAATFIYTLPWKWATSQRLKWILIYIYLQIMGTNWCFLLRNNWHKQTCPAVQITTQGALLTPSTAYWEGI